METLQGALLSLEHRYRVQTSVGRHAYMRRYQGTLVSFEEPVWFDVYEPLAEAGGGAEVFDRIKRSALEAHRLDHPAILRVLDYGELDAGVPFVISQRPAAPTLAEVLDEQGALAAEQTARLVDRVAEALEAAHRQDLSHGTLDPTCIHMPEEAPEEAVVGRFQTGITLAELRRITGAVPTPAAVSAFPPETFARKTEPPEGEAAGQQGGGGGPTDEFSPAADVYALGAVAYIALVGFHPHFDEDEPTDASEGILRVQNEKPRPPAEFGADEAVSEAVMRALARKPEARWESPQAFADALYEAAIGRRSADRSPSAAAGGVAAEPGAMEHSSTAEADFFDGREESGADRGGPTKQRGTDAPGRRGDTEDARPGPASSLVTLVVLLLLASNIAWFLTYLNGFGAGATTNAGSPNSDRARASAAAPGDAFELVTVPSEANVFRDGHDQPIGATPLKLRPPSANAKPLNLRVEKEGHGATRLSLHADTSGRRVTLHLDEAGGSDSAGDSAGDSADGTAGESGESGTDSAEE